MLGRFREVRFQEVRFREVRIREVRCPQRTLCFQRLSLAVIRNKDDYRLGITYFGH